MVHATTRLLLINPGQSPLRRRDKIEPLVLLKPLVPRAERISPARWHHQQQANVYYIILTTTRRLARLLLARARPLGRAACKGLGLGRGPNATLEQHAAEILEARDCAVSHDAVLQGSRVARRPQLLGDGAEAWPHSVH